MFRKQCAFLLMLTIVFTTYALGDKKDPKDPIEITPEKIVEYEKTFIRFAQELENDKWPQLQKLPDPDGWFGWAAMGAINFVMTNFTRYAAVRPKETKQVLNRAFRRDETTTESYTLPPLLQEGLKQIKEEKNAAYRQFMSDVLNGLSEAELQDRNLQRLATVMEEQKKKYTLPTSKDIENLKVPDTDVACLITTSLLTTCCVEHYLITEPRPSNHPHAKHKKRKSSTT